MILDLSEFYVFEDLVPFAVFQQRALYGLIVALGLCSITVAIAVETVAKGLCHIARTC